MERTRNFNLPIYSSSYKDIVPYIQQTVNAIDEALAKVAQGASVNARVNTDSGQMAKTKPNLDPAGTSRIRSISICQSQKCRLRI